MSILRAEMNAVKPNPANVIPVAFYAAKKVEEIIPLYSKEGKKIKDVKQSKVVREVISPDTFHNKGLRASDFSINNMMSAGIPLTPITRPLIGGDIDTKGKVVDYIEGFDYEQLKDNNVELNN